MRTKLICLTGIDGTGKTTQAQGVVRLCRSLGFNTGYLWARWEPFLIRPLKALFFRLKKLHLREGANFTHTLSTKQRFLQSGLVRRAWRALALFDYWLTGRAALSRAACGRDVLVLDRYACDFAVDQALNLGLTPGRMLADLEARLYRFFPQPGLTLVLQLPAAEAAARKQDGTGISYLQAREAHYRALLDGRGTVAVDASPSPGEVAARIAVLVERFLKEV